MFRHDPAHTGRTSDTLKLPLRRAWTFPSKGQMIYSSAAIVNGMVYFGTRNDVDEPGAPPAPASTGAGRGSLYCLDAATGKPQWRFNKWGDTGIGGIVGSPTVVGDRVYFSARDGYFYCVTTAGKGVWRTHTGGIYDSTSPAVVDGRIYFSSGYPNADFFCLNASDGIVIWRRSSETTDRPKQYAFVSPAVTAGTVYTGANNAAFFALDADRGAVKAINETSGGNPYLFAPTASNGRLIIAPGEYNPNVYALDLTDIRKELWHFTAPGQFFTASSPATDGKLIYIGMGNPDQTLYAIDTTNGKEKWHYPIGLVVGESFTSSPAIAGGFVIVGAGPENKETMSAQKGGRLLVLDTASGTLKWNDTLAQPFYASPAVSGHMVFIGSKDGTMYAYRDSSGTLGLSHVSPKVVSPSHRRPKAGRKRR